MKPASKASSITQSNPSSVLQSICSKNGFDLTQATFGDEATPSTSNSTSDEFQQAEKDNQTAKTSAGAKTNETDRSDELVSIRISPNSNPAADSPGVDEMINSVESASQIQQLAARLEATEIELQQREAELERRIKSWNQTKSNHQSEWEQKLGELDQQSSHVRCQQLHLMQLQADIIKSHEATRVAIESLVLKTGSDKTTIAALKTLQYEISGRFDYIARRWEHLSQLMRQVHTQIIAVEAVDDSVDWVGKAS